MTLSSAKKSFEKRELVGSAASIEDQEQEWLWSADAEAIAIPRCPVNQEKGRLSVGGIKVTLSLSKYWICSGSQFPQRKKLFHYNASAFLKQIENGRKLKTNRNARAVEKHE